MYELLLRCIAIEMYGDRHVNSLTTIGYLLGVFFGLWIPFLVRISTSAWNQHWKLDLIKASLTPSLRVHDPNHTHSLASFQWSGLFDQRALQLTESCLQIQKWCLYKARGVFPEPVCATRREMVQPLPTKALL